MSDIEILFQHTGDRQNDSHNSGMSENCDVESENISYHEGKSESQKFERKSTRNNFGKPPQRYEADVVCEVGVQEEPKTYQEAVTGPDRMDWIDAMNDELESIKNNGTWELVDLPVNRKAIGCKWVFKLKRNSEGEIYSESESIISELAICLKNELELSCLGDITCYLGIDVEKDSNGDHFISQRRYIQEIIQTVNLDNAKPSAIPLDSGYYKLKPGEQLENNKNYQKLIGQLLYVSVNTRPDISSSVSILSRKVSCPNQTDWNELKRVVRYLKGTSHFNLRLSKKELKEPLIGYADADWAEDSLDRQSNSGYIFKMNGGTISWASRKQTVVAISTAESEFVALTEASQEAMWLRNLLEDLGEKQLESTTT
ncbi:hypothetical protein JTB14_007660 [Gonioctena quinquepunctata]|nr:hypothetical protein JTB14_007660 [Gonioctena quinquepunctata]